MGGVNSILPCEPPPLVQALGFTYALAGMKNTASTQLHALEQALQGVQPPDDPLPYSVEQYGRVVAALLALDLPLTTFRQMVIRMADEAGEWVCRAVF